MAAVNAGCRLGHAARLTAFGTHIAKFQQQKLCSAADCTVVLDHQSLLTAHVQARAAVLTASQCATYDEIKQVIRKVTGAGDHFGTHLASSMVTGLVTTTATAPVDVIKTHMFVGELCPDSCSVLLVSPSAYHHETHCCCEPLWL